jgi:hypothetical protein
VRQFRIAVKDVSIEVSVMIRKRPSGATSQLIAPLRSMEALVAASNTIINPSLERFFPERLNRLHPLLLNQL